MAEDLVIAERQGLGLATIMARKGVEPEAIGRVLGVTPPSGPSAVSAGDLGLLGVGPNTWLAIREDAAADWSDGLRDRLGPLASVSDQSGAYIVHRLSGEGARRLLQRGVAIDLHPAAFDAGSVAVTMIAHIGVILRQIDHSPTYDIALFRSFAESVRHWLDITAASL